MRGILEEWPTMNDAIDPAAAQRFRCLQDLGAADLDALLRQLEPVALADGQVLFREGEVGDGAYLLASGRVELRVASSL